jgi:hypothetical protein
VRAVLRRLLAGGVGALLAVALGASPWASAALRGDRGADRARSRTVVAQTVTTTTTTTTSTTPPPSISLRASRSRITGSRDVVLYGLTTGVTPGTKVRLYKSPYPYRHAQQVRTALTGPHGGFTFTVHPDRNVHYRVSLVGTSAQATAQIGVIPKTFIKVRALSLGRAGVTIVIFHPRDLRWGHARTTWWFGRGRHGRFTHRVRDRTHKVSPYVTVLSTRIALPAGRYHWRVCFHAPGDLAMLDPHQPVGCSGRGYWGRGSLPEGYPRAKAFSRAQSYLSHRAGRTAFAFVDSEGREFGMHENWTFVSASVVKAMLLVAYLRRLDARGQHQVDSYSNSFLYPMIHVSDNNAATQCWSIVGDSGLYSVAHAARMHQFSIVGIWANAQISAYDQAKFFFEMDSLIPHEFVGYARNLLSTIAGYESWGIPAVARPRGYKVFFKGGWRGTSLGQLVHQIGRLEGHHRKLSMAVMTDGDPSMGYGIATIQGVTGRLL